MACEKCTQKAIELNAKQNEIINEAKKKANETEIDLSINTNVSLFERFKLN